MNEGSQEVVLATHEAVLGRQVVVVAGEAVDEKIWGQRRRGRRRPRPSVLREGIGDADGDVAMWKVTSLSRM